MFKHIVLFHARITPKQIAETFTLYSSRGARHLPLRSESAFWSHGICLKFYALLEGRLTTTASILLLLGFSLFHAPTSHADTFGSGLNTFDIEFVAIGNPNNPDDTTCNPNPVGKAEYAYRMGKFEISENMIDKANALSGLGVTHDNRGPNRPATSVSWFEAATFVNWLNDQKGAAHAYKFNGGTFELWQPGDAGYNPANPFRNSQAYYFLPSSDEWYKAAYYDPEADLYYDYPTGSDSVPDGIDFAGDTAFDAVFFDGSFAPFRDITDVGVLSPYGTAGQGGNVFEWEETEFDSVNDSTSSQRGIRSGNGFSILMSSSFRGNVDPSIALSSGGFRVASVPEPPALTMITIAFAGSALLRRRQMVH